MKHNIFYGLLCFYCLLGISNVQAQSNKYFLPNYLQKTPNNAAFEKYGEYQVNMFSGVPDISIPLYTIESGGLKVPVTLSYHASGIKVGEVASWAGLGWTVAAGGQISRQIMGTADENTGSYLDGAFTKSLVPANINPTGDAGRLFMTQVLMGTYNCEPDLFSYDFPGHGGKFYFDGTNNYKPVCVPFEPIQITRNHLPTYNGITSFTIKDEHGDNYFFGQTAQSLGDNSVNGGIDQSVSAWQLEKMRTQDLKDSVTFSYGSVFYSMPADATETITVDDEVNNIAFPQGGGPAGPYTYNFGTQTISANGSSVVEQQLSTILFKNGKAVFELSPTTRLDVGSPGPKSLQDIKIYAYVPATASYSLLKTIWFYQSYFGTNERLKLDSVAIMDHSNAVIQKYKFSYNSLGLPAAYNSKAKDFWGYYNGQTSQTSLIPDTTIEFYPNVTGGIGTPTYIHIGGAVNGRNPDSTHMQADMLQRITYPTGGYTDFAYQTNRYIGSDGVTRLAGGLRVSSIKSYDGINAAPTVKTYQYANARANFHNGNYLFLTEQLMRWFRSGEGGPTQTLHRRTFVSTPSTDIEAWDSVPVAYRTVTEYVGDGVTNAGKTIYRFTDRSDAVTAASLAGKPRYDSYSFARGHLAQKSVYANVSGTYRIVSREQNNYIAFPYIDYNAGFAVKKDVVNEGSYSGSGFISVGDFLNSTADDYVYHPTYYSIIADDNYLISKSDTTYDQTDTTKYVASAVAYDYGSDTTHQQVINTTHVDSKGNTRITNNKYAFNYPAGNAVLDTMVNRHIFAEPIEEAETYTIAGTAKTTAAQLHRYKTGNIGSAIVPDKVSILNLPIPVTNFVPSTVNAGSLTADSRYTQMISFDQYTPKNDIAQYTPRNSTPVSVIWDYNNALPVAQIKNGLANNCAYTSFEADGKGNWTFSGAPVNSATAPTGSRAYNLSSGTINSPAMLSAKSYIISYWSNAGAATVTGGSAIAGTARYTINGWTLYEHQAPAGTTAVTVSGAVQIDELRLYPSDAEMTTFTYAPNVGITSSADAKNQLTHYEYDDFQRLMNIKDQNGNIVKHTDYNYAH